MKIHIQNAGKTTRMVIRFIGVVFAVMTATNAFADSPREQLNLLVEQLRKTPNDNPLREQIIKLARELKPPMVVPEEARRAFVKGNSALAGATGADDYSRAVQNYTEAMSIAPWWGDIYFNNAKARELQQEYVRAIVNVKLFLLTNPPPEEDRKAKDYIYVLEDKKEKLTKEQAATDDFLIVPGVRVGRIRIGMKIEDALKFLGTPELDSGTFENRPVTYYVFKDYTQPYSIAALLESREVVMIKVSNPKYHTVDEISSDLRRAALLSRRTGLRKIYEDSREIHYCDPVGMRLLVNGPSTYGHGDEIRYIMVLRNWSTICDPW